MKKDLYIRVIEYSIEKNTEFNLGELFKSLSLDITQQKIILEEVRLNKILSTQTSNLVFNDNPEKVKVWCSVQDRFKLLEYQELIEARKSSREARWIAIFAIIISILSTLSSIFISINQSEKSSATNNSITNELSSQSRTLKNIENNTKNSVTHYELNTSLLDISNKIIDATNSQLTKNTDIQKNQ